VKNPYNKLNTAESEVRLDKEVYDFSINSDDQIKNTPKLTEIPRTYESGLGELVSQRKYNNQNQRKVYESNVIVKRSGNQKDVFVDPDIMQGMNLTHLKKMDLRSFDH